MLSTVFAAGRLLLSVLKHPAFVEAIDSVGEVRRASSEAILLDNLPEPGTHCFNKEEERLRYWGYVVGLRQTTRDGRSMILVETREGDVGYFRPQMMVRIGDVILMSADSSVIKRTPLPAFLKEWKPLRR